MESYRQCAESVNTKSERFAFKSARAASFCLRAASLRDLAASWGLSPMSPVGSKLLGAVVGFKHLGSFVKTASAAECIFETGGNCPGH